MELAIGNLPIYYANLIEIVISNNTDYVPIARLSQICRLETLIPWLAFCRHYTYFRSLPKYLNVTTRLAGNIISPSVTWNTDKPQILIHIRKATVSTNVIDRDGLMSLWDF